MTSSRQLLRKAPASASLSPSHVVRHFRNKGVQMLLDAIVDYMPSLLDVPAIKGVNPDTEEEEERPSSGRRAFLSSRIQDRY